MRHPRNRDRGQQACRHTKTVTTSNSGLDITPNRSRSTSLPTRRIERPTRRTDRRNPVEAPGLSRGICVRPRPDANHTFTPHIGRSVPVGCWVSARRSW